MAGHGGHRSSRPSRASALADDQGRDYAAALANGALCPHRLGCAPSQRIAAVAPIAEVLPADLAPRC